MIILFFFNSIINAQETPNIEWIRPEKYNDPAIWGIKNGIIVGLWPSPIENSRSGSSGGPRGLLRLGYEFKGEVYHINFIAIEPVVNGKIEFSEISPSRVDNKWGKLMWAGTNEEPGSFYPASQTRGIISHPDPDNSKIEELSFYVFVEQFLNGAHPYLKLSIRSDKPQELGIQIFNFDDSAKMDRCVVTATMGNYSRLRKLYLKDTIIDSRQLYAGFNGVDFIEKQEYPAATMIRDSNGDFIAVMETDESFTELSSWPQEPKYFERKNWRYRPFFKLLQYWRKEPTGNDTSLRVRVNGRAAYWTGGSQDKDKYIAIPGGPAYENFELRDTYYSGQKFYYGIAQKSVLQLLDN